MKIRDAKLEGLQAPHLQRHASQLPKVMVSCKG